MARSTRTASVLSAVVFACAAARGEEGILLAQAQGGFLNGGAYGALLGMAGAAGVAAVPVPAAGRGAAVAGGAPAAAPRDPGVDHSGQFPSPSRSQGDVGSCHTFASVGLIEAAHFRRTGARLQLSEADLFMRRNVLSTDAYENYLRRGRGDLSEGNDTAGTLQFALDNGVATSLQYQDFLRRYRQYREAERRTLEDLERQAQREPWYVRMLYDHRAHWVQLQQDPTAQRILQNYLSGNDRTLEAQREETRRAFAGLRMEQQSFAGVGAGSMTTGRDECRRAGADQTAAVLAELRAGRPIGIRTYTAGGSHAMIISGYRVDDAGAFLFLTRNSWGAGGDNHIYPHETCRIYAVLSVR
ncbi:MAG: hypothetical protein HYZ75_14580 [Elusimicrobia bacterium]|nr:hypothetical protein [Elusimicrobiota bacterium]